MLLLLLLRFQSGVVLFFSIAIGDSVYCFLDFKQASEWTVEDIPLEKKDYGRVNDGRLCDSG